MPSADAGPAHANRLIHETSPYLLQHAHNPVAWQPWDDSAFAQARREAKPIFLSVGYSACHWCHVMEKESFENAEVADELNARFIPIKVDREERPDVDDLYMRYLHLAGEQGGWPMSVFLTPEGAPFFGGTYFPRPALLNLLAKLSQAWAENRSELEGLSHEAVVALKAEAHAEYRKPERPLGPGTLRGAVDMVHENFDSQYGGLQGPRKFPPHTTLALFLELAAHPGADPRVAQMLKLTLDHMQRGGIRDHLGGGFHRYATDSEWFLPHFEKMLYDNAQLAWAYARASRVLKDPEYARTAREAYGWVLREMTAPGGAFYSALDADSEGEEGRHYLWSRQEVEAILGPDAPLFCRLYGVEAEGNARDEATRRPTGRNVLCLPASLEERAAALNRQPEELREQAKGWREKLLAVRDQRVRPRCDDKILTAWNALMVSSLARGSAALDEPEYRKAAVRSAEWLLANLRTPDGRWLATHRAGRSKLPAYLDDHAFLALAFLDLYDVTLESRWRDEAQAVLKVLDQHFWDAQGEGYFFVADDHEKLLVRLKNPSDNVTPSGNGAAAQALVRLWRITGDEAYWKRAEQVFEAFHTLMDVMPVRVESLLLAWHEYAQFAPQVALAAPAPPASATANPRVQFGPVIVELELGQRDVPGSPNLPVTVRLAMDQGWHVQGHDAREPWTPTRVRLLAPEGAALMNEKYPPSCLMKLPGFDQEMRVCGSTVEYHAELRLPANVQAGALVRVEVEFQACGPRSCEAPQRVEVSQGIE